MKINAAGLYDTKPSPSDTFKIPVPPPGVIPGYTPIAMDSAPPPMIAPPSAYAWAAGGAFSEGIGFLGYPYLAELSQRPEYRTPVAILAEEATREWLEIAGTGDEDKAEKIDAIEAEFERLNVQGVVRSGFETALHFGRSQIYLDMGHVSDEEKQKPLADDLGKINPKRPLRRLNVVEPLWTYPAQYNATDPLSEDFYRPDMWYVMGKNVHRSRLITIVPHPVPDMLKPAYVFGGMALSQMLKPYVDNWIRTRSSVSDAIHNFSVSVLKTNMDAVLQGGGAESLTYRAQLFNQLRDNRGLMMLDQTTEDFMNVSTPLSNLDRLQAQAQEHMCSVARVPTVKWFGLSPAGLNASSEGEIKAFHETTRGYQERILAPIVKRLLDVVQLSLFGEIDPDITYRWNPLWSIDEVQAATVAKMRTDGDVALVMANIITPEEARSRIAGDEESGYTLDLSELPELPDPAEENQFAKDEWNEADHTSSGNGQFGSVWGATDPDDDNDGEPRREGYPKSSGNTPYGEFDGAKGTLGDCVLVSSQEFRNEDVVSEKQKNEDFEVSVSPEFEYDGVKMRVVLDGHHSLSAALKAGITPEFNEVSSREDDNVSLIERGDFDDFFEKTRIDSDLHNPITGGDIW